MPRRQESREAISSPGEKCGLAEWPGTRIVDLWEDLKIHFSQLVGNSGPYFLRKAGKDTFIFSKDVIRALYHWGVYEGEPKTKKAKLQVQETFN